jgi:photosystem II stability/assembly factor-like uncharacterized protein
MSPRWLLPFVVSLLVASAAAQPAGADCVRDLRWRNVGPANMMGRIAAIDALPGDHRVVLIASASGGVFLSRNAGVTWRPIFDRYGSGSIGAAVFFQGDPDVIWVGTGEAANRNSSGWGDGVYKSTDGGRTFTNTGLRDTHHIAEIATHPTDPAIVYVAAPGHLWGYSGSRGLYKTSDGGQSWTKLTNGLPDDGKTGCTEVLMHPDNPEVLWCGMYHRLRGPASMHSGGGAGGIFKSTDGGASWRRLTAGLPAGETGMIDLAVCRAQPDVLVANVEADERIDSGLDVPGSGVYRSDDGGESWRYLLRHNTRPFYHGQVDIDPSDPDRIYAVSRDFRVSRDGGKTWRGKWWGGGGDDHDMWIAPQDGRIFYLATDQGAYLTVDDGRTVIGFDNMAIGQYYAIGVDMRDPYWIVGGLQDNGLWLGPSNSREVRGILNCHNTWVAEGDGFHAQIDPQDWRTIYTVNHVGFVARQNVATRAHTYITPTPETILNWSEWVDPQSTAARVDYTIAPGEHWFFGEAPQRPKLPPQFRFNWSSPFVLSTHNPAVCYFGGNHLFRSVDRGDRWRIVSPDLSTNDPKLRDPNGQGGLTREVTGGENHCTIITIGESPLDPAVVWVGTDDGNVQLTRDGGANWSNVREHLDAVPPGTWVSRVEPSNFDAGVAYVTFDNHRRDDMRPYVFRASEHGRVWHDITGDLPDGHSVYVIREDPQNPRLLFVGTEFGAFASLDAGASWVRLGNNLPTVAVHDLVIHPRDGDLIAGTHGRSIWILDDISPLRQLTDAVRASAVELLDSRVATAWRRIDLGRKQPDFLFAGENPPRGALLHFWLAAEPRGEVELAIEAVFGGQRRVLRIRDAHAGLNRVRWDLQFPPTEHEERALRENLQRVITVLRERVGARAARLDEIAANLERARTVRALNAVRASLVDAYAGDAPGGRFFGPKLEEATAAPGEYGVTLTAGNETRVGRVRVRADPLDAESR